MRTGIIAAIAAVVIVIGGAWWYNNQAEQSRLELERAAEVSREEERRAEIAAAEQAAREAEEREAEEAEALAAQQAATEAALLEEQALQDEALQEQQAATAADDAIVVGDEIAEGDIVVPSATAEPVILDAEAAATTTEVVDADATGTADGAVTDDPDLLLTPANFDREQVLALINTSDALSEGQRSTLAALVEGAAANPAMLSAALSTVRSALGLPAAN